MNKDKLLGELFSTIQLTVLIWNNGDHFTAECPEMGLSIDRPTQEEAQCALRDAMADKLWSKCQEVEGEINGQEK